MAKNATSVFTNQFKRDEYKVTGGLTLFHQSGIVRALSVFCMVEVTGGFGTRKLGVGKIAVAYIPGLS